MEIIFLSLWAVMSVLYWRTYVKDENILTSALKVAGLLGFVYGVMKGFDWLQAPVPAEEVITFGEPATEAGPRVPWLANGLMWFVVAILLMVAWYARNKFTTVASLMLSTWDRGNWYMLPMLFVLMTIGLLLVAAAASPVLSPFIYTLF
jgi:hypothetical protein